MQYMWIIGNARREILTFYGPAVCLILTLPFIKNLEAHSLIALTVALGLDSSHTYITAFQTWFNKTEMSQSWKKHVFLTFTLFLFIFSWCFLGIPYFWSFILYFTVLHHIQQYQRIYRLSCSYNQLMNQYSSDLYALTLIPFVIYHFRPGLSLEGFLAPGDILLFESSALYKISLAAYTIFFIRFMMKLIHDRKNFSLPVFVNLAFPIAICSYCFIVENVFYTTLLPIMACHGVIYYVLVTQTQIRTQPLFQVTSFPLNLTIILLFGVTLATLEAWFIEEQLYIHASEHYESLALMSLGIALVTTPTLYHYVCDEFIWKRINLTRSEP